LLISIVIGAAVRNGVTYQVDQKPMLCIDSFLIEEKGGAYETPIEKIGRESRKPHEHVEASTGLEHEKDNRLLKEQSDHDDAPLDMRPVLRSRPENQTETQQDQGRKLLDHISYPIPANAESRIGFILQKKKQRLSKYLTVHFRAQNQTRSPGQ